MASYKGYTSAWISSRSRWVIYDKQGNECYAGAPNHHTDPLHKWVDDWADDTPSPSPSPKPHKPQNIPTGFSPEIGSLADAYDSTHRVIVHREDFYDATRHRAPAGIYEDADDPEDFSLDELGNWGRKDVLQSRPTKDRTQQVGFWQRQARKHGIKPPLDSTRKLGPEHIVGTRYNPKLYVYDDNSVYNSLDLETVGTQTDKGSILSASVVKRIYNKTTGNWDTMSKWSRYYYPTKEDLTLRDPNTGEYVYDQSVAISGLTDENIRARRKSSAFRYSKHFNEQEFKSLLKFLGDDPVVGQNIAQFDWPKLLHIPTYPGFQLPSNYLPKGGLIDTLHIAEAFRGTGKGLNSNTKLFELAYGKAAEEFGFTAHDALEDAQITARVYEAMMRSKTRMGVVSRGVFKRGSTRWRDSMINGISEVREMSPEQIDALNQLMDGGLANGEGHVGDYLESDIAANSFDGSEVSRSVSLNTLVDADFAASLSSIQNALSELSQSLREANAAHRGVANLSVVREAGRFDTEQAMRDFLEPTLRGSGDETWEVAMKRARMYRDLRLRRQRERAAAGGGGNGWDIPVDPHYDRIQAIDASGKISALMKEDNTWNTVGDAVSKFGQAIRIATKAVEDYKKVAQEQARDINSAGSYFIPKTFKETGARWFQAANQSFNSVFANNMKGWEALGGGMEAAGQLLHGHPLGAVNTAVKTVGDYKKRGVEAWGQDVASRINLWAGFTDLLIAPARLLANAFRGLLRVTTGLSSSFLKAIGDLNSLGIPLTHLTGMSYSQMQRSYIGDAMIGARQGTTSSSLNAFANAQMDLYSMGQVSTDRLVASAMLGSFNDVYGFGGDTQEQYANTINNAHRQLLNAKTPQEEQRIMMLAGKIDSNMPTILQQMTNLSKLDKRYNDYRYLNSKNWDRDNGITRYTATDEQRARYTRAGMQFTALTTSMGESKNMIVTRIWEAFGKDLMSGLNDVLHMVAEGNWKGALKRVKEVVAGFWEGFSEEVFGKKMSFGDVWGNIKAGLANFIQGALPLLGNLVKGYVELVGMGYAKLAGIAIKAIDDIATRLSFTSLDIGVEYEDGHIRISPQIKSLQKSTGRSEWTSTRGTGKEVEESKQWYAHVLHGAGYQSLGDKVGLRGFDALSDADIAAVGGIKIPMADGTVLTANNRKELADILPELGGMRQYGYSWNDIANNIRVAQGYHVMKGDDIKQGILSSQGFTQEWAEAAVMTLVDDFNRAVDGFTNNFHITLEQKDESGKTTGVAEIEKKGSEVLTNAKGTLQQLMNVTRTSVSIMAGGMAN